jgi:hypothetical protein
MRRLQQDFAARGMGLSDRFAKPEVEPEDRSGGAPAACAGISPMWLVCANSLNVALAGSSP